MTRAISEFVGRTGDLGRRIVQRRTELELTVAQVAKRAGMAADYLEYLEQTPTPDVGSSALTRLSFALEIPSSDLLGGDQGEAPGGARARRLPQLISLDHEACRELLRNGGIGRAIFFASARPVALPVNFAWIDGDVVFRSTSDGLLSEVGPTQSVSFEVDRIDDAMSEGWSVLATGILREVRDPSELAEVEALGIEPWAGGDRSLYFRLDVTSLTGKRITAVR